MITVSRQFTITSGTAPYTYTWTVSNPCMSVQTQSGTTNGVINATFYLTDETCLDDAVFTLMVTDVNGCRAETTHTPDPICEDLNVGNITENPGFSFTVTASNAGCAEVTFDWNWNTALFSTGVATDSASSSTLVLTPNPNIVNWPASTTISVVVTDCYGCSTQQNLVYELCQPQALTTTVEMFCTPTQFVSSNFTIPNPTGCPGYTFNWASLQLSPSPFSFNQVSGNEFFLTAPLSTPSTSYVVTYSVETTEGIRSGEGVITVIVNDCSSQPIFIPDLNTRIDCDLEVEDFFYIDIEDVIISSEPIDWTTFQVLPTPTPLSQDIELVVLIDGRHYIKYEVPAVTGTDAFRWTICTTDGDCAFAPVYVVILECEDAPTATNDSTCVSCGQSRNINVLANDTDNGSPLVLSSVAIASPPSVGTAVPQPNGTITYNAPANHAGTVTFTYTVMDTAGNTSNAATVTLNVICAGIGGTGNVCNEPE